MKIIPNARAHRALMRGFRRKTSRGFALVVALTMMMLISVLVVGLLSLSTLTLKTASADSAQAIARMNARMALNIAIGEVQKYLGPDQRISARAETLAQDKRVGGKVRPASAKAWWLGVSHSDHSTDLGENRQPVVWLLSGLKPGQSPKTQLDADLENPVTMIGEGSIDTRLTGGETIDAGRVMLRDREGKTTGAYAYFVDDQGMRAQLVSSNPEVRNDRKEGPLGGGVIPGTYSISVLDNMSSFVKSDGTDLSTVVSLNNLPLAGGSKELMREKYFGYTMRSYGVLSDVKNGGLKKDLTIAFENDNVFNQAFPSNNADKYILMDPKKRTPELSQNGYIHWRIFHDFYNIKKEISMVQGTPMLGLTLYDKWDLLRGDTALGQGRLGPHQIGTSVSKTASPYGEVKMKPINEQFKHNPITSILAHLQQNVWVDYRGPSSPGAKPKLFTRGQLWTSHYNPYNIGIYTIGDTPTTGPRIINYPQAAVTVGGTTLNRVKVFGDKTQTHVPYPVVLQPGRSHVFGYRDNGDKVSGDDGGLYTDRVKDLTLQSVYTGYDTDLAATRRTNLNIEYVMNGPTLAHGVDHYAGSETAGDFEVAQIFFSPFSWNEVTQIGGTGKRPGISKTFPSIRASELNENTMFSYSFVLRTTKEPKSGIRPLIDSNIRAVWNNPKWDSDLNLQLLASYSDATNGVAEESHVPMTTINPPYGYSFWGASHEPNYGVDRVVLFDIPREDLISLGQLQHAAAGRFSYEPTYIVGNSYANIRIPTDSWMTSTTDTYSTRRPGLSQWSIQGRFNLYDASYLVNEVLWDSYVFTTLPQVRDNYLSKEKQIDYISLLQGKTFLPNPRYLPYEPVGTKFDEDTLKESGNTGSVGSFDHNAGYILVDGAFNVNSTSVDAWEAFLSGTHQLPVGQLSADSKTISFTRDGIAGVRFPRVTTSHGGGMQTDAMNTNFWTGFRDLTPKEVRQIATQIVEQVRKRGPFYTMGEFVNRKLENSEEGKSGALQAALDDTVNKNLSNTFTDSVDGRFKGIPSSNQQASGFPGQLLQGDILQALSPFMQVRSDTFTIRAYGEARNPLTDKIEARAWCEATIQRYPDAVHDGGFDSRELVSPSSPFGRQCKMVSFRWLHPSEI